MQSILPKFNVSEEIINLLDND